MKTVKQDKSETQLTQNKADVSIQLLAHRPIQSSFQLTKLNVVDAKYANGQTSSQINSGRLVSQDNQLFAPVAPLDNLLMVMNANNAHLVRFNLQQIQKFVLLHNVMDNIKSDYQLITSNVEDVIPANGLNSHQTHKELNALKESQHLAQAA